MSSVLADKLGTDSVAVSNLRPVPTFAWNARDVDAETRCEREVARAMTWRARLLGWLIEYNKY